MGRRGEIDVDVFIKQQKREKQRKIPTLDKNFEYMTPKEFAKLIGKHPMTIYEWLGEGRVEGALKVGRNWKIPVRI